MYSAIPYPPVPVDTARAAEALYGKGNIYLRLGDALNDLLSELISNEIQLTACADDSIESKVQCAMLTIFQFAEELTNQQMVEALRSRLDLKYALHLPLNYRRFEPGSLCEFRRCLYSNDTYRQFFQNLLDRTAEIGFFKSIRSQTLSTRLVLDAVCTVTRLDDAVEAMHQALEALAVANPDWLRQVALPYWYDRYSRRTRMPSYQNSDRKWYKKALEIGTDIHYLLGEIDKAEPQLRSLPEVRGLGRSWDEQFVLCIDAITHRQEIQWRLTRCSSCNQEIDQLRRCNEQTSNDAGLLSNPNPNGSSL